MMVPQTSADITEVQALFLIHQIYATSKTYHIYYMMRMVN